MKYNGEFFTIKDMHLGGRNDVFSFLCGNYRDNKRNRPPSYDFFIDMAIYGCPNEPATLFKNLGLDYSGRVFK